MSTGLKIGLGIAALVVVYELYSSSSTAAATAATVAPVATASPLAPAPGSIAPIVPASLPSASSVGSKAQSYASKAVGVAASSSLAIVTGGLSTSTGRAVYTGIGKGIASGASSVYHGIASIF